MKTKMKKLISIKSVPVFVPALLIVLGTALAASREPISICGVVDLGSFNGTATVVVECDTFDGAVQVIPKGGMFPRPDGGYDFPEVIHQFDFGDGGTLTTAGAEFTEPTDENPTIHTLHGNMEIIDGSGVFEGASGDLRVNGQMDWSVGQATFESHGTISN